MPMSRSSMTKIGVCSRSARSKACAPQLERLGRIFREQQHVLGVAVRGIGAGDDVALLRARRHAGRGPGALHVEHHRWNFGEIGEAEKLLHQRDAGPEVAVKARAPFQAAPITMPIEASSSSACTMATLLFLVSGSTRSRAAMAR